MKWLKSLTLFKKGLLKPPLVLVAMAVALRIPTLFEPYWYGDEAIYLTLGEGARQGLVWYRDLFDHKPPMIYLLATVASSVFWFRLVLLFWHAATIVLFWDLAKTLFQTNRRAVITASVVFTLLTTVPLFEGNIANAEIFMLGPAVAGMLILLSAEKLTIKRAFFAGTLFSVATLFKVPAAFDMLAIVAFWGILSLWKLKNIWQAFQRSLVLGAGFLVPVLLSAYYYFLQGALKDYLSTAWFFNFDYITRWQSPGFSSGEGFQTGLLFRAEVLALILVLIVIFRKRFDKTILFASVWLSFALFATLLSARPYPHYIIQVVPPLSVLLAALLFGRQKIRLLTLPFLLIFSGSLLFYNFGYYPIFSYYQNFLAYATGQKTQVEYFSSFDSRVPQTYELSRIITQGTTRKDKIFIWGTAPELYALSRRVPPTRFITSFHIGDVGGQSEVLQDLKKDPPRYIIVIQNEHRPFPGFWGFLEQNYIHTTNVFGADVWRRVNPKLIQLLQQ